MHIFHFCQPEPSLLYGTSLVTTCISTHHLTLTGAPETPTLHERVSEVLPVVTLLVIVMAEIEEVKKPLGFNIRT